MINEEVAARRAVIRRPGSALQSLDFAKVRAHQLSGDWAAPARLLADAARRCQAGGADVVADLHESDAQGCHAGGGRLDVPLLHIADAVAGVARSTAGPGWASSAPAG